MSGRGEVWGVKNVRGRSFRFEMHGGRGEVKDWFHPIPGSVQFSGVWEM